MFELGLGLCASMVLYAGELIRGILRYDLAETALEIKARAYARLPGPRDLGLTIGEVLNGS